MLRKPEQKPRIELTPIPHVEGVEIARCFDWYGPRVSCFPGFTFSTPMRAGLRAKIRYGAFEAIVTRGVLRTAPNHALCVEELSLPGDGSGEQMVLGFVVATTILTEEEQRRLLATTLNPVLDAPGWPQALIRLCTSLADPHVSCCEKELQVRSFVERALAETNVVREEKARGRQRIVSRARDYLHANIAHAFSLEDVARETGLTKWHLARTFRSTMGVSMGEYARHLRAHHALQMLRVGKKASLVAAELGYCDQPHFTREMQCLFGFTPGHYAKNALKSKAKSHWDGAASQSPAP
jgi:AraC-like DNA-binding protein